MNINKLKFIIKNIINEQSGSSEINIQNYKPSNNQVKQLEKDLIHHMSWLSNFQIRTIYSNISNMKPYWIVMFVRKEWKMNQPNVYSFKIYPTIENNYIYYDEHEQNIKLLKNPSKSSNKTIYDINYDS